MRRVLIVAFALVGLAVPAWASPRVSLAEARQVALARVPGKVVHEKLKKKKKGHDHYNFKIAPTQNAKPHKLEKVSVDADTGAILSIKQVADKKHSDDD
ncbi:MAG TPA: PepSY domain-containing protein [Kofleriaceae bacterium]|jgi:uncharacterized membrane protein YkoI